MPGMFITLCEPPSRCVSRLSPPYMKQSSDYCFEITNAVSHRLKPPQKKKERKQGKNEAEALCRLLFVRFWVIRLFMWAGTPRQRNNDMSLQVVCRVFPGFWRGLHGKVFRKGWKWCVERRFRGSLQCGSCGVWNKMSASCCKRSAMFTPRLLHNSFTCKCSVITKGLNLQIQLCSFSTMNLKLCDIELSFFSSCLYLWFLSVETQVEWRAERLLCKW